MSSLAIVVLLRELHVYIYILPVFAVVFVVVPILPIFDV